MAAVLEGGRQAAEAVQPLGWAAAARLLAPVRGVSLGHVRVAHPGLPAACSHPVGEQRALRWRQVREHAGRPACKHCSGDCTGADCSQVLQCREPAQPHLKASAQAQQQLEASAQVIHCCWHAVRSRLLGSKLGRTAPQRYKLAEHEVRAAPGRVCLTPTVKLRRAHGTAIEGLQLPTGTNDAATLSAQGGRVAQHLHSHPSELHFLQATRSRSQHGLQPC